MKLGKRICETLKGIRRDIAVANEIDYSPTQCTHEGDCAGSGYHCGAERGINSHEFVRFNIILQEI